MSAEFCNKCGQNLDTAAQLSVVSKAHAEAIDEWARLEGLLKAFLHRVESVAFAQPSEQLQTLWAACQYVRKEIDGESS